MEIGGIFSALIIGLIVGALGRLVVPGKQDLKIWVTLLIGVVAALLGTLVASLIGVADTRGPDWIELALQVGLAAAGVAVISGASARRKS
ncbi:MULTISPECIES: GlsB/YeaQ/YmgE family stress response membrane protein [unclassified Solwaraspora]|uniref:GlsB/YeaQ/YmgE family stress response membrane protein n=1 Tax=unclassified Solwaraspora TaxID=2627926 RepID=UPI00259B4E28|nr:GlsB/YeaQ/YmgE family stress response membrane protein [Solwaraspora sp. WMMA2056]WJK42708.1 GlsB/YeaQ/YmgE family stress response membrane protein [Solwaraspora sp. WMMA2056]